MKQVLLLAMMTALLLNTETASAGPSPKLEDGIYAYFSGDKPTALRIYRQLSAQGDAAAQNYLGNMYMVGEGGVAQDYVEALKWYRLAAAQGDMVAQISLARMYFAGQGVARNYVLAHMWVNLAAVTDKTDTAQKSRDIIAPFLTSQQISQAQKMARECQKRNLKGCD